MSPWISVLVAALMAAFGVFVGFRLGRRAGGPSGNAPRLPSDLEHLLDLLRRSHRAIAAVLCGADGQLAGSTHPRGVPRSVVERAMATARLALANDGPELLADRGWIRSEMRQVETGNRAAVRNPPGKDLRHPPGRANAQGYDYAETQLQDRATHRTQHRYLVERSTGTTIRVPKKPPPPPPRIPE